jgi:hypothetical protein
LQLKTTGRAAVLSIHGSVQYTLSSAPFDAAVYEAAMTLPVKLHGECKVYDNGKRVACIEWWYDTFSSYINCWCHQLLCQCRHTL